MGFLYTWQRKLGLSILHPQCSQDNLSVKNDIRKTTTDQIQWVSKFLFENCLRPLHREHDSLLQNVCYYPCCHTIVCTWVTLDRRVDLSSRCPHHHTQSPRHRRTHNGSHCAARRAFLQTSSASGGVESRGISTNWAHDDRQQRRHQNESHFRLWSVDCPRARSHGFAGRRAPSKKTGHGKWRTRRLGLIDGDNRRQRKKRHQFAGLRVCVRRIGRCVLTHQQRNVARSQKTRLWESQISVVFQWFFLVTWQDWNDRLPAAVMHCRINTAATCLLDFGCPSLD